MIVAERRMLSGENAGGGVRHSLPLGQTGLKPATGNDSPGNSLRNSANYAAAPGAAYDATGAVSGRQGDADLAMIVNVRPTLSDAVNTQILAMMEAARVGGAAEQNRKGSPIDPEKSIRAGPRSDPDSLRITSPRRDEERWNYKNQTSRTAALADSTHLHARGSPDRSIGRDAPGLTSAMLRSRERDRRRLESPHHVRLH